MDFGQKSRESDLFDFTSFFAMDFFKFSDPLCSYLVALKTASIFGMIFFYFFKAFFFLPKLIDGGIG